jgi:hypothetical protein
MEDVRFDRLTRRVGQLSDRRTMVRTALAGSLALLGLGLGDQDGAARRRRTHNRANLVGYEDDQCETDDDCLTGLVCEGARTGIAPGFPTPIVLPIITGKPDRCRYRRSCGGRRGDACKNNGDCCSGQNLRCTRNRCKRRG